MEILDEALKLGIAPAIVVAVYLIIIKIIDTKKENKQIKFSVELTKSITTISDFVVDITKNIIEKDKDKCKFAITNSMNASGMRLIQFVSTTIVNNHIETNKENILVNIHNIINAEYYSVYAALSMYMINGVKVSDYLNKDWMNVIEQDMIDIIYNSKLNKEDKIQAFANKLNINFQSYITFITNNSIK